jgi:1-acyl-sn-glycerol-3-phosphate acyltransferase
MRFQRFARFVLNALMSLFLKREIIGLENVPRKGPLVVIMNHINFLDPILVSVAIPRDIAIMSKVENFSPEPLGAILRAYGSFPVHRGEGDLSAIRASLAALGDGKALLLAPEGTRSPNAQLQPAYEGMAMITSRAGAPVVPVAISGAEDFSRNLRKLRKTRVKLHIGEPFEFTWNHGAPRPSRNDLRLMSDEAMYRISSLLPPSYRGAYPSPEKVEMSVTIPIAKGS